MIEAGIIAANIVTIFCLIGSLYYQSKTRKALDRVMEARRREKELRFIRDYSATPNRIEEILNGSHR